MGKRSSNQRKTRLRRQTPAVTNLLDDAEIINLNTTGLPALPVEIIHIILSYLPGVPFPYDGSEDTFVRSAAAIALSLTCRWLRATVSPLMWHTVDVCRAPEKLPDNLRDLSVEQKRKMAPEELESRAFAVQLVQKLEVVTIREPTYASNVHTLVVKLTSYMAKNVYQEFVRALTCFTNLQVLQIISVPPDCCKILESAISRLPGSNKSKIGSLPLCRKLHSLSIPSWPVLLTVFGECSLKRLAIGIHSEKRNLNGSEIYQLKSVPTWSESLETVELYPLFMVPTYISVPLVQELIPLLPNIRVFPVRFGIRPLGWDIGSLNIEDYAELIQQQSKRLTTIQFIRDAGSESLWGSGNPFHENCLLTLAKHTNSLTTNETSTAVQTAAEILRKMWKNHEPDVRLEIWIWECKYWYSPQVARWTTKGVPAEIIEVLD